MESSVFKEYIANVTDGHCERFDHKDSDTIIIILLIALTVAATAVITTVIVLFKRKEEEKGCMKHLSKRFVNG